MTSRFAEVIGDPVAQSKSPAIHRFWLGKLGIEGEYDAHRVPIENVPSYFARRRDDALWMGCNVTMPLKQAVQTHLDTVSRAASRIGAVNTVYRQQDRLIGENTDAEGFLEPLAALLTQPHLFRMARVFGAGGAARAVVAALLEHGVTVVLAARDIARAAALLAELDPGGDHHAVALDHFAHPTDFAFDDRAGLLDLVVNTTPLGMEGQPPLALDFTHVPPDSVIYDIVTTPVHTPLLREAEARGFRIIDGLAMLIGQAAAAFRLFFGAEAPRQHDAELRALLTA